MANFLLTVSALLHELRTNNPTAPRLTWYGADNERVELSGRVMENWVAKTANFLVDDLDAEPGTVVALEMAVHWRSLVWLLAAWAVGSTVVTDGSSAALANGQVANIVATTDPEAAKSMTLAYSPTPVIVAVALPALAMHWPTQLPAGAVDYSGEVRAHADVFFASSTADDDAVAWESEDQSVNYGGLLAEPTGDASDAAGPQRVLLRAQQGWDFIVPEVLRTWAAGGSVVLLDETVEATQRLRSMENVSQG